MAEGARPALLIRDPSAATIAPLSVHKIGDVILAAKEVLGKKACQFVPAHPIAGGAQHGAAAAKADLFDGKQTIICQLQENAKVDVELMTQFWEST